MHKRYIYQKNKNITKTIGKTNINIYKPKSYSASESHSNPNADTNSNPTSISYLDPYP